MSDRRRNTVRIDYDKLAEAIVKAENISNKEDIKNAIIEANQEIEDGKPKFQYSRELLKFVISPMLIMFVVFGIAFAIGEIVYIVNNWHMFDFKSPVTYFQMIILTGIFVFSLAFAIFSGLSYRETNKTDDTNFVFSMFSNLIAFVALIVAAIALVK